MGRPIRHGSPEDGTRIGDALAFVELIDHCNGRPVAQEQSFCILGHTVVHGPPSLLWGILEPIICNFRLYSNAGTPHRYGASTLLPVLKYRGNQSQSSILQ